MSARTVTSATLARKLCMGMSEPHHEVVAFGDIYRRYAGDVFRFAYWACGHRADAEDIVAETFARAFAGRDKLRASSVKGYLLTIARNLAHERRRRQRPEDELEPTLADPGPDPERNAQLAHETRRTLAALSALPETDRDALLLACHEGLALREVAELLGVSLAAIKVRIHRARLRLAQALELPA